MMLRMRKPSSERRTAAIYARVSSKEQEKEGFSIPAQLRLLREYASQEGLTAVHEFVDVETAKEAGRTGFGEMLDFFRATRDCGVLLVEKTDRLYRNIRDWVTVDELGLEIHFVKENVVLAPDSRSSEKFMHGIKVLMAKNYIDNLSEETRKGMLEKAKAGLWPSYAPLGYRNVGGDDGKRRIEPDAQLAPIVARMFEWYATGNFSIKEVAHKARAAGFVFRKSKDPVNVATVDKILRNRIYTGDFDWDGGTYRGVHEPLVSQALWDQAQEVRARRLRRTRRVKYEWAFSGHITCGHCGCSIVGELKKGRYVYYHCSGYKGRCPEPYVREEVLETKFTDLLRQLTFDVEVMDWMRDALKESHQDEQRDRDEAIARLEEERRRLQQRIDAMYVDKLDGRITADFYDRRAAEWRTEQDRLLAQIHEHQTADQTYLDEGVRLLELARGAHLAFEKQSPAEKRRLLNFVVSNCVWKNGELTADFRQPFDMLAATVQTAMPMDAMAATKTANFENWLLR